jgi:hypothetical protein
MTANRLSRVEAALGRGQSNQRARSTTNAACDVFAINTTATQSSHYLAIKGRLNKKG